MALGAVGVIGRVPWVFAEGAVDVSGETAADGEWQDVVVLLPERARQQLAKAALREVIRGEPHIGASASSFL